MFGLPLKSQAERNEYHGCMTKGGEEWELRRRVFDKRPSINQWYRGKWKLHQAELKKGLSGNSKAMQNMFIFKEEERQDRQPRWASLI